MNIDFSTSLGVVGVILTVFFFVIGYRQTIGAKRERARAANKVASDALFRRLTLETLFDIDALGVNILLSGWALDARVRLSDMYSPDDLRAVLLCRIVESDYLSGDQRKEVIRRLNDCFKEVPRLAKTGAPVRRSLNHTFMLGTEISLAVASGATALAATSIAAFIGPIGDWGLPKDLLNKEEFYADLKILTIVFAPIALTAIALVLFTKLRESTRSTDEVDMLNAKGVEFENRFLEAALKANPTVDVPKVGWPDLTFKQGARDVAVEIRSYLNSMHSSRLRSFVHETEQRCDAGGYSCTFIVSPMTFGSKVVSMGTEKVQFVTPTEALNRMRAEA